MSVYITIKNIEKISNQQLDIDIELLENGGEITPEIEEKQKEIDELLNTIVSGGADEIINSLTFLDGRANTIKEMKDNITTSAKSLEKLINRVKYNTGAILAVNEVEKLEGNLGSIKVRDTRIIDVYDKESVEDKFKFTVIKFNKVDYLEKEFEIAELIKEVSQKDEVNETLLKKEDSPKGAKVEKKKTITAYKKRPKKESK